MDPSRARRSSAASTLRTAAVWATVSEAAAGQSAALGRPLRVLDLGGGTGGLAVPLAEHGHDVTVVDPSPDALASLRRRAAETGVADRVRAVQGDTDSVHDVVGANARYDLICVHGTLEVADDPDAAVAHVTGLLDEGAVLSIVVAQRLSAALARALAGEFERAQAILERPDGRWGDGDPGPRRYDEASVVDLLTRHGLDVRTSHGGSSAITSRPPCWTPKLTGETCSPSRRLPAPSRTPTPSWARSAQPCMCSHIGIEP